MSFVLFHLFCFLWLIFLFVLHKYDTALWKHRKYIWAEVVEVNYFPENPFIDLRDNFSQFHYGPYGCMHCGYYYTTSGFPLLLVFIGTEPVILMKMTAATSRKQHTGIHFSHITSNMHAEIWCVNNPLRNSCRRSHRCKISQATSGRRRRKNHSFYWSVRR